MKDKFIIRESLNESAGWIAMWNGKKCEIKKDEAKDLWGAKQLAIKKLGVPKSKVGELALDVAFEDDEDGVSNAQFEGLKESAYDKDNLKDALKELGFESDDGCWYTYKGNGVFGEIVNRLQNKFGKFKYVDEPKSLIQIKCEESLKEEKEPKLPKEVTFTASEVALDSDDEDPSERLGDLLSDKYGFCHFGFEYEVKKNENGEPSEFVCKNIEWDTSESLDEAKDIEVKDIEKMTELEPGDEVEVTKEMDDVFDKSLEMAKEFGEEPKLETFDEQMDFLAKDEQEAIDGYEKVLALVEDEHVKEQLEKILAEEKAHKQFLEKVKEDKSLEYSHEEHEEEKEDSLTTSKDKVDEIPDSEIDVFTSEDEVIDDVFVDESCDDDFGFNHILDEEHKEAPIDWNCLDDECEIKEEKHVCEKCGKEVCECDKLQEEDKPHTGHIKAKKPIELKARIEK